MARNCAAFDNGFVSLRGAKLEFADMVCLFKKRAEKARYLEKTQQTAQNQVMLDTPTNT